jgi:hypothetical protein
MVLPAALNTSMSQASDVWYLRLPDGRVLRANSTAAVRHHLERGDVPLTIRVRRSPLERWALLEDVQEFSDLATFALTGSRRPNGQRPTGRNGPGSSPRNGGLALHPVGVRGLVIELTTALDSSLTRGKLLTAAVAGLSAGSVVALTRFLPGVVALPWPLLLLWAFGLLLLGVVACCTVLVSGLTYVELAHLRPARWAEARSGMLGKIVRLVLAYLIIVGGVLLLIAGLRDLPGWAAEQNVPTWAAVVLTMILLVLEVLLWPVLGFALLLGPIVVVEGCSAAAALRQWATLLREHLPRAFLSEALAGMLALVVALPLLVPVELAAWSAPQIGYPASAADMTLWVLRGLALTPALAYLMVVNVHIYLGLRYEHSAAR